MLNIYLFSSRLLLIYYILSIVVLDSLIMIFAILFGLYLALI